MCFLNPQIPGPLAVFCGRFPRRETSFSAAAWPSEPPLGCQFGSIFPSAKPRNIGPACGPITNLRGLCPSIHLYLTIFDAPRGSPWMKSGSMERRKKINPKLWGFYMVFQRTVTCSLATTCSQQSLAPTCSHLQPLAPRQVTASSCSSGCSSGC